MQSARMKLLERDISGKDGQGRVVVQAEDPEDMWHIYNIILAGDYVRTTTLRKVRERVFSEEELMWYR